MDELVLNMPSLTKRYGLREGIRWVIVSRYHVGGDEYVVTFSPINEAGENVAEQLLPEGSHNLPTLTVFDK